MEKLVWGDKYKLGFKPIDDQHQVLVRMIGELSDVIRANQSKLILEQLFSDLVNYTVVHFAMEERLMQTYVYPASVGHIKEHENLKKTAVDLQTKYLNGKKSITLETIVFLNEWLAGHILKVDRQFADFLKARGVTGVT